MIGNLIIARHHESEWNKLGKWTGVTDVSLTPYGREMSYKMSSLIADLRIDHAFASAQVRTLETLLCMKEHVCRDVPVTRDEALNERDYGDYTGKNKWEMKDLLGEAEFDKLRRGWDYPVPHGETLRMVYDRVVPYYKASIMPLLIQGKNVLVVAHGNSLRALIKYLEGIPDDRMQDVEMPFGSVVIYSLNEQGTMTSKQVRSVESAVNA